MAATERNASARRAWPLCARPIFVITRNGHPVEPAELASSWRIASERREGSAEVSAFDAGLTPAEKLDLARVGIAVIPLPYSLPEEEPWLDLQSLPDQNPAIPDLPLELLPEPFRSWLASVASQMAVPLSGLAAASVVALASVVGRAVSIRPEGGNGLMSMDKMFLIDGGLFSKTACAAATFGMIRPGLDTSPNTGPSCPPWLGCSIL